MVARCVRFAQHPSAVTHLRSPELRNSHGRSGPCDALRPGPGAQRLFVCL